MNTKNIVRTVTSPKHLAYAVLGGMLKSALVALSVIPMVVLGDTKGRIGEAEPGWNRTAAYISAAFWLFVAPLILLGLATAATDPLAGTALWTATALSLLLPQWWTARRFAADLFTQHLPLGTYLKLLTGLVRPPRKPAEGEFPTPRDERLPGSWAAWPALLGFVISTLATAVGVLTALPSTSELMRGIGNIPLDSPLFAGDPLSSLWPMVSLLGTALIATTSALIGLAYGKYQTVHGDVQRLSSERIAACLKMNVEAFTAAGGTWEEAPDGSHVQVFLPVKFHGVMNQQLLEAEVALRLPEFTVTEITHDTATLFPINRVPEVVATRQAVLESGGLLVGSTDIPDTALRPAQVRFHLAPGKPIFEAVDQLAQARGLRIVEWNPLESYAIAARLSKASDRARTAIAYFLQKPLHEVELIAETDAVGQITGIQIAREPEHDADPIRRRQRWLQLANAVRPKETDFEWIVEEDSSSLGGLHLMWRKDPLALVLPYDEDPSTPVAVEEPWQIGIFEDGTPATIDFANTSHTLIAGSSRSGKSVASYSLLIHLLRMGDRVRLMVADPNDTTVGPFEDLASWTTSSTEPQAVTELMQWILAEMDRRKPILRQMQADKLTSDDWTPELPGIVIVIDEAANYLRHPDKNAAAEFAGLLSQVAAQSAKYGIRLVLITQRPSAEILSPTVRSQIATRISFRLEDKESATMAFPGIQDPAALLTLQTGVGYLKGVAGEPQRFRAAYLADHWGAAAKISRRLPTIDISWKPQPSTRPVAPVLSTASGVDAVQLPELSFTLDELEFSLDS